MTAPAIVLRPAADLVPYANNSRTHSSEQIEQLKASFRRFGVNTPLGVDADGILVGHGRLLAMVGMWEAGEEVPGPGKREPLPRGMVPTLDLSGLTPEERRADDDWYSRPLLPDLFLPEHVAVNTGLLDANGKPIMRAPNPCGFGKDGDW